MRDDKEYREVGAVQDFALEGDMVLESGGERRLLEELYRKGYVLADFIVEQIVGPQIDPDEREEIVRAAFGRLAGQIEKLKALDLTGQRKRMCAAVRDATLSECRRRIQRELAGWIKPRPTEEEFTGGRMMPGVTDMIEGTVVEDHWYLYLALSRLDPREFTLLIERYQNRLNDREIGKKMGMKARNVRIYMARARRKVNIYYEEEVANGKRNKK